jgi:hypothetical protein
MYNHPMHLNSNKHPLVSMIWNTLSFVYRNYFLIISVCRLFCNPILKSNHLLIFFYVSIKQKTINKSSLTRRNNIQSKKRNKIITIPISAGLVCLWLYSLEMIINYLLLKRIVLSLWFWIRFQRTNTFTCIEHPS